MQRIIKTGSGSSVLNEVIDFGGAGSANNIEIDSLKFHLSTVATAVANMVVTVRSKRGSAYDSVILTQAMASVADVVQTWDPPLKINGKDRVVLAWTNDAASFKTWGYQMEFRG